ncbi:MAG: SGNH/GDSL hydrolase family protein [Polyangiales bacterium]
MKYSQALAVLSFVSVAACGSGAVATSNGTTGGGDAGSSSSDGAANGSDTGSTTTTQSLSFKTLVVLGDSISDGGGQGPFFYDLLHKNDDTLYPAYAGKDLQTKYGSSLAVVHGAVAGSTAKELIGQAQALPTTLAGPVLVTITIGGNDVTGALGNLLLSGSDTAQVSTFQTQLNTSLAELTKPNRFGQGVEVRVLLANIYDPSDGTGNFKFADGTACPGALQYWPANQPTDPSLVPWETTMTTTAQQYSQVVVLGLKDEFHGHGVPASPTWFYSDCIHPNATGHEEIRELFWTAVNAL